MQRATAFQQIAVSLQCLQGPFNLLTTAVAYVELAIRRGVNAIRREEVFYCLLLFGRAARGGLDSDSKVALSVDCLQRACTRGSIDLCRLLPSGLTRSIFDI